MSIVGKKSVVNSKCVPICFSIAQRLALRQPDSLNAALQIAEKAGFDFVLKGRGFRGCGKTLI